MDAFYEGIIAAAQAMSIWEVVAVILGIAYLVLAMRQSMLCWYAAFGSTAIFSWLFWDVSLVMESGLNVYYLIMAIYGWSVWRGNKEKSETNVAIKTWSLSRHALIIAGVVLISLVTGYGLEKNTSAALPYLDSFTTWGAVITTYMVAQKVLENWLYWQVINSSAIVLYALTGFYATIVMFSIYLFLAMAGYFKWRRLLAAQHQT